MSQGTQVRSQSGRQRPGRAIRLAVPSGVRLRVSERDFLRLCLENPDLRMERSERGVLEVMSPTFGGTGARNALITYQLVNWAITDASGTAFDSSTGFRLPGGATCSPDVSWIRNDRWNALTEHEREEQFSPICPDFVAELASRSDKRLKKLRVKMHGYIAQGARFGWLIDPRNRTVEIYRPGRPVETLTNPTTLSGEDVLPGFVLDLKGILYD